MNNINKKSLLDQWLYRLTQDDLVKIIHSLVTKMTKDENKENNEHEPIHLRKLFLRNLSFQTNEASLLSFFSQYGPVEEIVIKCEKDKRSKGFGFIIFYHTSDAKKALDDKNQFIDGRLVEIYLACNGKEDRPKNTHNVYNTHNK